MSSWPKDPRESEIGLGSQIAFLGDMEGMVLYTATILGDWSSEEVQLYMMQLRREIRSTKIHGWFWNKVVWAQKPES